MTEDMKRLLGISHTAYDDSPPPAPPPSPPTPPKEVDEPIGP